MKQIITILDYLLAVLVAFFFFVGILTSAYFSFDVYYDWQEEKQEKEYRLETVENKLKHLRNDLEENGTLEINHHSICWDGQSFVDCIE